MHLSIKSMLIQIKATMLHKLQCSVYLAFLHFKDSYHEYKRCCTVRIRTASYVLPHSRHHTDQPHV